MRNIIFRKTVIFIIAFSAVLCLFFFSVNQKQEIVKKTQFIYPQIKHKDSINNFVIEIYDPIGLRASENFILLTIDNNSKFGVLTDYNFEYNCGIMDVIGLGDLLIKEANNDTIFIYKKGNNIKYDYYFIIRQPIY
jgi:hypothetical protein